MNRPWNVRDYQIGATEPGEHEYAQRKHKHRLHQVDEHERNCFSKNKRREPRRGHHYPGVRAAQPFLQDVQSQDLRDPEQREDRPAGDVLLNRIRGWIVRDLHYSVAFDL